MTVQEKDSIIVKGEKYHLFSFPLDSYWSKNNPKPEIRLPRTSCWRGYIAHWEIIDDYLFLMDIRFFAPSEIRRLDYVFPESPEKVKATWYTGELKIPIGEVLQLEIRHDTIYESDWFIRIEKGKVVGQRYKANY